MIYLISGLALGVGLISLVVALMCVSLIHGLSEEQVNQDSKVHYLEHQVLDLEAQIIKLRRDRKYDINQN